jgi:hypothetical protein
VHDNRYSFPNEDRVNITPLDDTYEGFPDHSGLNSFDIEDRKLLQLRTRTLQFQSQLFIKALTVNGGAGRMLY